MNTKSKMERNDMATKQAAMKEAQEQSIIAFKAFGADWKCRDFQYEIGKTYTHDGDINMCHSGFHACAVPFDCWSYYSGSATFARVSLSGASPDRREDSKIVAAKITIEASMNLPEWIKAQVETVLALCKSAKGMLAGKEKESAAATGDSGHAAATGDSGHAAATGDSGHAAATGDSGHAAATGYYGHAAATGDSGHAAATGNYGHAAATGDSGHAAATGYSGHAAATGYYGHAAATGNYGHAAATGDSGHAAATGNYGVAFAGFNGKAKASASGSFAIAWYSEKEKHAYLAVGTPGKDGIEADTWYCVQPDGKLVKAEA